jgi:hypothetical protein
MDDCLIYYMYVCPILLHVCRSIDIQTDSSDLYYIYSQTYMYIKGHLYITNHCL